MQIRAARLLIGVAVGVAVASTAACGAAPKPSAAPTPSPSPTPTATATASIDPNRPTPQQIVAGLQKELAFKGQLASQMSCIGQAFYQSNLSDDALNAIAEANTAYAPSSADQQTLIALYSTTVASCSPDATPSPTRGS